MQLCEWIYDILMESSRRQPAMTVQNESSVEQFCLALFWLAKSMPCSKKGLSGILSQRDIIWLVGSSCILQRQYHTARTTHVPDLCLSLCVSVQPLLSLHCFRWLVTWRLCDMHIQQPVRCKHHSRQSTQLHFSCYNTKSLVSLFALVSDVARVTSVLSQMWMTGHYQSD